MAKRKKREVVIALTIDEFTTMLKTVRVISECVPNERARMNHWFRIIAKRAKRIEPVVRVTK